MNNTTQMIAHTGHGSAKQVKLAFKSKKAKDRYNGRMGEEHENVGKPGIGRRSRTYLDARVTEKRRKANKRARKQRVSNARRGRK